MKIKVKDKKTGTKAKAICENAEELARFFAEHTILTELIEFRNALSKVIVEEAKK